MNNIVTWYQITILKGVGMREEYFYSVEELASILRVKPNTIQSDRWVLRKKLKPRKIGKRLFFSKNEVSKLFL